MSKYFLNQRDVSRYGFHFTLALRFEGCYKRFQVN